MKKFLLICSAVALFYEDCAWGMVGSYDNLLQQSQQSRVKRGIISKGVQKLKKLNPFKRKQYKSQATQTEDSTLDERRQFRSQAIQTEDSILDERRQSQSQAIQTEDSTLDERKQFQSQATLDERGNLENEQEENRFIKIGFKSPSTTMGSGVTGVVLDNTYLQYHYVISNNSKVGYATPTTVKTITGDDLRCWNDIAEIRYANDVSYDKLENPKVILYRNKDNSCYIILRIGGNKHGVFYGINENNVELGGKSFSVYDVSEDVGSFSDGVSRLIYVDESGLYFVLKAENPVEDVIDTYKKEGKFEFKGSVIKVSAINGSITLDGESITKDNFFDNWVEQGSRTVLSTKQPKPEEIIRNFYPPKGSYGDIYLRGDNKLNAFTEIPDNSNGYPEKLTSKEWMNFFIDGRISVRKSKAKRGAKELVENGTFSSILSRVNTGYTQKVREAIAAQVAAKGGKTADNLGTLSIVSMVYKNQDLFKDPEFVRSLKPGFAELEKNYAHNKESQMWIPFEIVRNL